MVGTGSLSLLFCDLSDIKSIYFVMISLWKSGFHTSWHILQKPLCNNILLLKLPFLTEEAGKAARFRRQWAGTLNDSILLSSSGNLAFLCVFWPDHATRVEHVILRTVGLDRGRVVTHARSLQKQNKKTLRHSHYTEKWFSHRLL